MLFKEIRASRQKYFLVLLGFVLAGFAVGTLLNPSRTGSSNSIFHNWTVWVLFLTNGAAILIGADSIAEETGKNTLSFLLTHPITRTKIYAAKYLLNAAFLGGILLITSLLMFLLEQIPQGHQVSWVGQNGEAVSSLFVVDTMPADEAFTYIAVNLGVGLVVLALTTFVSIFSRSTVSTIVTTILITVGLSALYSIIHLFYINIGPALYQIVVFYDWVGLGHFLGLLAVVVGIYFAGLRIFKAREF